jgi:PhzF family phenazine biosynthesis protein
MSRSVEIFQVDAFTSTRFCGNPAGVVLGADSLSAEEMQLIARELNNGDTAFVGAPTAADHDLSIRFFTPRAEAAFVGHATLAAHAVLQSREAKPHRRQKGKTGIVEIDVQAAGGFSIRQPAATLGRVLGTAEVEDILGLLGTEAAALDPACPVQIAGASSTRLFIGLRDAAALATLSPQLAALAQRSGAIGAQGYFLFARHGAPDGCDTQARMFCPALGINEDPVSGNAHGMLGVYLAAHGLLPHGSGNPRFAGAQGHHMRRPGRVEVEVELDAANRAQHTRIAGQAVIVFQSLLTI